MSVKKNVFSSHIYKKKSYIVWGSIVAFIIILGSWSVFAVVNEDKKRGIAKVYAKAFALYAEIDISKPYTVDKDSIIDKAIDNYKSLEFISGSFPQKNLGLFQMASLFYYKGDISNTVKILEKLKNVKNFDNKLQAMSLLVRIYEDEKKLELAITIYENLLRELKDEPLNFVRYKLGVLYSTNDKTLLKAIDMYSKIQEDSSFKKDAERNILLLKNNNMSISN